MSKEIGIIGRGSSIMQLPEEVLHHILGYVAFADVKSARLVNKYWRQIATTPLRRLSKRITVDRSVLKCITEMGDGQFPVCRLKVRLCADDYYGLGNTENCLASLPGICAWVKELNLEILISGHVDMVCMLPTDCVYKELTQFNLRVIVEWRSPTTMEFWKGITGFVRSILENSPNLRDIHIWSSTSQSVASVPVIEDIFPNSNSVGISKLSDINLTSVLLEEIDFDKWSTLNLKLRKLALSGSIDLHDRLPKFLETQSGTLQKLIFYHDHSSQPVATFKFPKMEKLQQLGFTYNPHTVAITTFPGIDYAALFPCLKKLCLEGVGIHWSDFLGSSSNLITPVNTVEELIFPYPWTVTKDEDQLTPIPVLTAARLFPALKKLEMYAEPIFTEAVYANMPNLEVLSLKCYRGELLDEVITGLSWQVRKTFRGHLTKTWIEKLKTAEERSIARLQNLTTLKLSSYTKGICFSRLSYHVLEKMSSLKCLDALSGKPAESYSADEKEKQLMADLRERFKFVILKLNDF